MRAVYWTHLRPQITLLLCSTSRYARQGQKVPKSLQRKGLATVQRHSGIGTRRYASLQPPVAFRNQQAIKNPAVLPTPTGFANWVRKNQPG